MAIAGHIDRRMMSRYSHIRRQARRAAVEALCGDTAQSNSTVHQNGATVPSYVIEKNGGDDETRTRDLYRDSAAGIGFTTTYKTREDCQTPRKSYKTYQTVGWFVVGNS